MTLKTKTGCLPNKIDYRDYDYFGTHHAGGVGSVVFPETYWADPGLWMPSQNAAEPIFNNPAMYFGCTDYTTADLVAAISGVLQNPMSIEEITHANANGGGDVRQSLLTAVNPGTKDKDGNITKATAVFNVKAYKPLDWFDSGRYAIMSGLPTEKREVSWCTPWFPSWEKAALNHEEIMPMPTDDELNAIRKDPHSFSWHNSALVGWKVNNGSPVLGDKSWQGTTIGSGGWIFFTRDVVNTVMSLNYTAGFTITLMGSDTPIKTIDVTIWQKLMSKWRIFLSSYLGLRY